MSPPHPITLCPPFSLSSIVLPFCLSLNLDLFAIFRRFTHPPPIDYHRSPPLSHSIIHRFCLSLKMQNAKLTIIRLFIPISLIIFPTDSLNCPCQNYGTETSCTTIFQNRDFLCQSAVFRSEALKCAKTCQMCCERPEFKCNNKKDETTCQQWSDEGWCSSKQSVMANFCPNKCGLCNSITQQQQQNNECRNKDETLCNKMTPNDCASENVLVRYKMYMKCQKLCEWC